MNVIICSTHELCCHYDSRDIKSKCHEPRFRIGGGESNRIELNVYFSMINQKKSLALFVTLKAYIRSLKALYLF